MTDEAKLRAYVRDMLSAAPIIIGMPISARNRLKGTVEEAVLGTVMAHIVVRVGDNLIESVITRRSADELQIKKGDAVTAIIKATEVMIQKD